MEDNRDRLAVVPPAPAEGQQQETAPVLLTPLEAGALLALLMQATIPVSQAEEILVLRDKLRAAAPPEQAAP
jgi:hypothetical protein